MARLRTVPRYQTVREALTAASVGLTHQQLADRAKVTKGQLRGALRAKHDRPMPHVTKAMADANTGDITAFGKDQDAITPDCNKIPDAAKVAGGFTK